MYSAGNGQCKHFDCSNRTSQGYCRTSVCINPNYANVCTDISKKSETAQRPPLGCKPYYIAIPERIRQLSESITAHAGAKTGIVEMWAKEIRLLSNVLREMEREE